MAGFFSELKRRRVYQAAAIYAVAAWGLAQVVDFVAERLFMPAWLPTVTAIVFIVGFPVAIFLAWVFDLGPNGIQRTGIGSIKGVTSIVAAVVMLVGGTFLVYAVVWPKHDAAVDAAVADANSVAVLPFTFHGQPHDQYLSDGIAEEILFALSSLTDLRVAARTSSFSYRDQSRTAADITRELGVRHVVEGTIRLLGDRLRVTASLVRGDTNLELWSQSYEEPIDDIFKVQEDIAARVAEAVRIQMGAAAVGERPRFRAVAETSEAYRLYLQGRFLWHQRGADNIRSAIVFFEQALDREPEFAGAWAGLASAYMTAQTYGAEIEDRLDKAARAARRATALDPALGEPYATLAQLEVLARNFAAAERLFTEGVRLSPQNTSLRLWYATMLISCGRSSDANKQAAIALQRDPAYPILHANFGFSSFQLGRLDVAKTEMETAWDLGVRPWFMWHGILDILVEQGAYDAAIAWFDDMPKLRDAALSKPYVDLERSWVELMARGTTAARSTFEQFLTVYVADPVHGLNRAAYMLASIGEGRRALDMNLRVASQAGQFDFGQWWVPSYSSMRLEPGFKELAEMTRLADYWRETEWPDVCGPGDQDVVVCYR